MPYKNKQTNQWIGQVVERLPNGNKKTHNHRCKTKKEASEWEEWKKQELRDGPSRTSIISLAEWATAYLDDAKEDFVFKTFQEKEFAFKRLFAHIDPRASITFMTSNEIRKYMKAEAKIRSGNAVNKQRKNLSAAWTWGIEYMNLPEQNPFKPVKKRNVVKQPRRVPTQEEFQKVYDLCKYPQDRNMLDFALLTGARRGEIFKLRWDDVDFDKQVIQLWSCKNPDGQPIGVKLRMKPALIAVLLDQHKITGGQQNVFMYEAEAGVWAPYLVRQHFLRRLCEQAEVTPRFGFHGIRHLAASIMAAEGAPIVEIQTALRHTAIATTSRYIHIMKCEDGIDIAGFDLLEKRVSQFRQQWEEKKGR